MRHEADLQSSATPSKQGSRAFVYLAAVFAALGRLLFGYDTREISGAELFFRNEFTLSTFEEEIEQFWNARNRVAIASRLH
jgi:hypothetical protein